MAERRRLTLADMENVGKTALQGSTEGSAARRRRLTAQDMFPAEQEKPPAPFEGGSTLQATVPLPGDWPTVDTGIPIGQDTAQFLAGAGKRFADVGRRGRQLVGAEGAQEDIDASRVRDRPLMETTPGMLGNMLPDVLAMAPLGGTANLAGRSVDLGGIRASGLLGGVQGFSQPVSSSDSGDAALMNTLFGVGGGALGSVVGRGATNLAGKAANLAPGVIPDRLRAAALNRGVNLPEVQWRNPEARRLSQLGHQEGIPLSIGDLEPTSKWRGIEDFLENMPSGRIDMLRGQQAAVRRNVENLGREIGAGAKGRESAEIAAGLKERFAQVKKEASDKFKLVDQIAKADPNIPPIKPVGAHTAVSDALNEYPALFDDFKNNKFMSKLLGLEKDTGPQPGLIINPKSGKPFEYDQELTFNDAQYLRRRLGEWYSKLDGMARKNQFPEGLDGGAVRQAAKVFAAFDQDLDNWGQQPGADALNAAWADARSYFKENVVPYRNPDELASKTKVIRDVIGDNIDVETLPAKILPTRETSIAQDVMELSAPRGQEAVKSALIDRMTRDALEHDTTGLDTAALLRYTNRHGHSGESVFGPDELARIQNTRDLARAASRSGDLSRTEGGGRLTSALMGGSAMAGLPFAAMYGLGSMEGMTPAEKLGIGFLALPAAAMIGSRGMNMYSRSPAMQGLHFAEPALEGGLGAVQRYLSGGVRGAGEPTLDEFRTGALGHRP